DLIDADCVILIDDGDRVVLEQGRERIPHVQVAGTAIEVFMREQKLGSMPSVPAQTFVVGPDQVRLADRSRCLELPQVFGSALQAELTDSSADGSRADQSHFPARVHHCAELFRQVVDSDRVEHALAIGQDTGTYLDDPDPRGQYDFIADKVPDRS